MKIQEALGEEPHTQGNIPYLPQKLEQLKQQIGQLKPIDISKLLKDLEDIKRGGSQWRSQPSVLGYNKE